jgi:O-antigen/teichoic acid export membrane protein
MRRDPFARDVMANVLGKVWSGGVALAFAPAYVRALGIEAFGLVAVFTALRTLCAAFDLGLTTTLNRELARERGTGGRGARDLLRTLELVYWGLAALIVGVCAALAPWIARGWVQAQSLSADRIEMLVRLMGVAIALEWLFTFYAGGLLGLQRQVLYNAWYAALSTLRYVGVLPLLWYVSPSLEAFFGWQAAVGLLGAAVTGRLVWSSLPGPERPRFRGATLRAVWRFAAGASAVAITGLVLSQLDRIVLTRLVPLSEFGYYGLALTAAGLVQGAVSPVFTAVFPRLSAAVAAHDAAAVVLHYHRGCRLLAAVVLPVAAVMFFFAPEVLRLWTLDPVATARTERLLRVMTVSASCNGLLMVPYALLLAHGRMRLPLVMNVTAIVVLAPLTVWTALAHGLLGASVGWAAYNVLNVAIGMQLVHRSVLPGETSTWYVQDVARPALVALSLAGAGWLLVPRGLPVVPQALAIGIVTAVAGLGTARALPDVWSIVQGFLRPPAVEAA